MNNTPTFKYSQKQDIEGKYHIFVSNQTKSLCGQHTEKSFVVKNPGDDLICMDCYGAQITLEEADDKKSSTDDVFISSRVDNINDVLADTFDYEGAIKKDQLEKQVAEAEKKKLEAIKKRNDERMKKEAEKRLEARKRRQMLIKQKQKIKNAKNEVRAARAAARTAAKQSPVNQPTVPNQPVVKPNQPVIPPEESIKNVQFFTKRGFCRVLYHINGVKHSKGYRFTDYSGQEEAVTVMKEEFEKYLNINY